jgi:hypothetical protein
MERGRQYSLVSIVHEEWLFLMARLQQVATIESGILMCVEITNVNNPSRKQWDNHPDVRIHIMLIVRCRQPQKRKDALEINNYSNFPYVSAYDHPQLQEVIVATRQK